MNLKSIHLLLLLCLCACIARPTKAAQIELCPASVLTWKVDMGSIQYDFVLTKLHLQAGGGLSFSYEMKGYSSTQGSIAVTPEAMASARKQYNYFTGGEVDLGDRTTVFVSKLVANELKKGGANMQPEEEELYFKKSGKAKLEVMVDGEMVKLKGTAAQADNGNSFLVWKHKSYPLILKMELGWSITLSSIETNC